MNTSLCDLFILAMKTQKVTVDEPSNTKYVETRAIVIQ